MARRNRLPALRSFLKSRMVVAALLVSACTSGDYAAHGERTRSNSSALGTSPATLGEQGPGPITNGAATSANPPNIAGATEVVVAHPTNPDVIYIGTVNGGVWGTTNATAATPHWVPLTDFLPSLSIRALALDPTNPQVLIAGTGACSNFFGASGPEGFIYLTQNGGSSWTVVNSPVAQGQRITSLAIRGSLALASTGFGQGSSGRILRSTNGGNTWVSLNGTGNLPANLGGVFDLVADPTNSSRYYAAASVSGVFRTDDSGATWTELSVNDPAPNPRPFGQITASLQAAIQNADNARLSVAQNGRLYVATSSVGQNAYVGFTDNQGASWSSMDIPRYPNGTSASPIGPASIASASNTSPIVVTTAVAHGLPFTSSFITGRQIIRVRIAGVQGNTAANGDWIAMPAPPATPGGPAPLNQFILLDRLSTANSIGNGASVANTGTWQQWVGQNPNAMAGFVNIAVVADPTNANVVYVSGDAGNGFTGGFSSVARGLTTVAATGAIPPPQWANEVGSNVPQIPSGGTATGTDPHADSRAMTFAANGLLLETSDGGIFQRTSPRDNTGDWFSLNTDIESVEIHSVAYDSFSDIVFGGTQDNETPMQSDTDEQPWNDTTGGDGGDVAVDVTSTPGVSVRYTSSQGLGGFTRWTFDANNVQQSETPVALVVAGTTNVLNQNNFDPLPFVTQVVLDKANPLRMVIGGGLAVYESFDAGATVTSLGAAPNANSLAYGHPTNADVLWAASNAGVFVRPNAGSPLALTSPAYPGSQANAVVMSGPDPTVAYVADQVGSVFVTAAPGGTRTWTNITGDLSQQNAGNLHAIRYIPSASGDRVVVAGNTGVFMSSIANPGVWTKIGTNLPNVLVFDLDYNAAQDLLTVGTLGRGAWIVQNASKLDQAPKALCQNVVVSADATCLGHTTAANVNAGSSDPDGDPITLSLAPAGPFTLGTTSVTLTVADNHGASATCTVTVDVVDTTPPVFGTLLPLTDRLCAAGEIATAIPTPSATDNCAMPPSVTGTVIASNNPAVKVPEPITGGEVMLGVGTFTIQWVASDGVNQTVATQTLTIGAGIQTTNSFTLNDRAIVRTASGTLAGVVNSGTGTLSIGNDSHVGDLLAVGPVTLRDRSLVQGSIVSEAAVTEGNQDTITGPVLQHVTVTPPPTFTIGVTFPATNRGNVDLEPGQRGSIAPGAYNQVRVASRADLTLSSVGDYLINSLDVEPQATIMFNSAGGTVRILVQSSLTYENAFVDSAGVGATLGYFGSQPASLLAAFTGTLVAPNTTMTLGTDGSLTFTGEFFARNFDITPSTTLVCR